MKASMIFYRDWYEMARSLSDEERLMIYDAVMEYAFDGKLPEDKFIKTATALMLSAINRDSDKYEKKCEKLRQNINKRWERQRQVGTTGKNCTQMNTNEYNSIQTDYDNETDNEDDNDNDSTKRIVSDDTIRESGPLSPVIPPIDLKELIGYFNAQMRRAGALIPAIRTISGQRKTYTLARIREYGKETFAQMIRMAAESDFLNGKSAKGWTATYDWLVYPSNFVKVIEGNYNNRSNGRSNQQSFGTGERKPSEEDYPTSL